MQLTKYLARATDLLEMKPDNLRMSIWKTKIEHLLEVHNDSFQWLVDTILRYEKDIKLEDLRYYPEKDLLEDIPVNIQDFDFGQVVKFYDNNGWTNHARIIEEAILKYQEIIKEIEELEVKVA